MADKDGKLDTPRRILAGLGAGIAEATLIVTPFEGKQAPTAYTSLYSSGRSGSSRLVLVLELQKRP